MPTTSAAAPNVAAVAALMLQVNPTLAPTEVRAILAETALSAGHGVHHSTILFGAGIVCWQSAVF